MPEATSILNAPLPTGTYNLQRVGPVIESTGNIPKGSVGSTDPALLGTGGVPKVSCSSRSFLSLSSYISSNAALNWSILLCSAFLWDLYLSVLWKSHFPWHLRAFAPSLTRVLRISQGLRKDVVLPIGHERPFGHLGLDLCNLLSHFLGLRLIEA